jgi:hypothetical protein
MRPTNLFRTIAAVALLSAPVAVQAQGRSTTRPAARPSAPSQDRDGYSVSLGLGAGSNGVSCTNCTTTRKNGASGYLRVGKGITPSLMMGVELNGWNKSETAGTASTGMMTAIAQWYPSLTNGFFLKTGAGVGRSTAEDKSTVPSNKVESTGFGYQFGLGYDMSIARQWSITPYVNYLATTGANAKLNGVNANQTMDANYFQYGLGLSWH